ncbi:hypothetical protein HKX48_001780 [Thoreauomyces humboldtii]|nr:hypothetical protein HKX48_001780 [Thoreauomyces humboldtii]
MSSPRTSPPLPRKPSLVERAHAAIESKLHSTGVRRVQTTPVTHSSSSNGVSSLPQAPSSVQQHYAHQQQQQNPSPIASSTALNAISNHPSATSAAAAAAARSAAATPASTPPYSQQSSSNSLNADPQYSQNQQVGGGQSHQPQPLPALSMNVSDYRIGQPIGYGSSATVYIATYLPTGTNVAIKMIDLDMFERNQIDELRREIQIMSLSKHPNLLPVYGSFVSGSKLYIVTPFLSSGSCLDIMKTAFQDGMDEVSIATILRQALLGLVYLHKNGLIHRDVKAGNLLIHEDGLVQLADFGVSSSLMDTGERRGLRKTFVGTPCWMAPEVMEQSGYDYKADIWSFGITALELATGHAPFAKFAPLKVLMLTLQNEPPTLDRDSTKFRYSRVFKEMIDTCLVKDPSKRPNAEKLLAHPFFKLAAKKQSYLVLALLQQLPPITQRAHNKRGSRAEKEGHHSKGESWDFTTSSEQLGHLVQNPDGGAAQAEAARRTFSDASVAAAAFRDPASSDGQQGSSESIDSVGGSQSQQPRKGVSFAAGGAGAAAAGDANVRKSRFTVGGSPATSPNVSSLSLALDIANGGNAASPAATPLGSSSVTPNPSTDNLSSSVDSLHGVVGAAPAGGAPSASVLSSSPAGPKGGGEVRKGRFSVGSGPTGNPGTPLTDRQHSSPIDGELNAVGGSDAPLERKPSRFAVHSLNTPTTGGALPANGTPTTPGPPTSQSGQQQVNPSGASLPRSLSDRRGRFEVRPSGGASTGGSSTAKTPDRVLLESLHRQADQTRGALQALRAALTAKGTDFESLVGPVVAGHLVAALTNVPDLPVSGTGEEGGGSGGSMDSATTPLEAADVGATPVGGVEWMKRENDALRKQLDLHKAAADGTAMTTTTTGDLGGS